MADEGEIESWSRESIPDEDVLFLRIHCVNVDKEGKPTAGAFVDHGEGMSVDWNKYSTAEAAQARAKNPTRNGIVKLAVDEVRRIPGLSIEHRPSQQPKNRAHSEILGDKKTDPEVRVRLRRAAKWVVPYKCACANGHYTG